MAKEKIDIRDLRDGGFLWIDKAALKLVSKKAGSSRICIYAWLCYYANSKEQNCFPSITTLAQHCHVTRRMIMYVLKDLEKLKLISVERKKGKSNTYRLLNVSTRSTGISGFTSEMTDTGVVSLISPALVKPGTHEQELAYQELFNNKAAAAFSEEMKELKTLCDEFLPEINLYKFMQSYKNNRGHPPPIEVMIKLCRRFKEDKNKIKNVWGWFKRTVEAESAQFFAQQNIKEHEKIKKEPATVGRILAQMAAGS